jgi:hypothetical protein
MLMQMFRLRLHANHRRCSRDLHLHLRFFRHHLNLRGVIGNYRHGLGEKTISRKLMILMDGGRPTVRAEFLLQPPQIHRQQPQAIVLQL